MGKMPTQDLLNVLEIPDAEAIAKRLQQELMLMALARMKKGAGGRGR